ncbi:hypothetical protein CkaCkLH20_12248 [Colletotrichum karsti]|uniref:Cytochrome P450 n=1 Tax=Colletotrichum karsti TaxID=1095194 RepID=A0A9P6LCZ8_9PEZI|nr:uncharacterized protein CkaCkLH20_12248 [Colletotrichum karsti]KAF9870284.1 hypothetical protein CkaCkLH20_12248 [Colletotrichum karsti]
MDVNTIEASKDTFEAEFLHIFNVASGAQPIMLFHPTLSRLKFLLPRPLLLAVDANIAQLLKLGQFAVDCIKNYHRNKNEKGHAKFDHPVIFDSLEDRTDAHKGSIAAEFLVAGSDTSALTITYALYYITANPTIREKLMKELLEVMPTADTNPTLNQLEQLPYLTGVVKECLRMACPVPGRLPRIVPNDKPLIVDGKVVPPGTLVGMSAYNMHFSESLWGPDVNEFNPDRWLGASGRGLDHWLAPFSKGSRACIGQNLATAEIYMAVACLFRRFNFSLPPGAKLGDKCDHFTVFLSQPGLPLSCKPKLK